MQARVASKRSLHRHYKLRDSKPPAAQHDSIKNSGMQVLVVSSTPLYRHLAMTHSYPHDRALEIGSAHGHCTALFRCPAVGVELNLDHVEQARQAYSQCRFICGDIFDQDLSWLDTDASILFLDIGGNRNYKPVMKALAICIKVMKALRLIVVKSIELRSFLLRSVDSVVMVARDLVVSKDDDAEAADELAIEIRRRGGEWPLSLIYSLECGPRLRYLVGKKRILAFLSGRGPLLELVTSSSGPLEHRERVKAAQGPIPPPDPQKLLALQQELAKSLRLQLPIGEEWSLRAIFSRLRRRCLKKFLAIASDPKLYQQASDSSIDDRCLQPWSDVWQVSVAVRHLHAFLVASPEFIVTGSVVGDVPKMDELWSLRVACATGMLEEATAQEDDLQTGYASPPFMALDQEIGSAHDIVQGADSHLVEHALDARSAFMENKEVVLRVLDCKWRFAEENSSELSDLVVERAWLLKGEQVITDLIGSKDEVLAKPNVLTPGAVAEVGSDEEDAQTDVRVDQCNRVCCSGQNLALVEALHDRNGLEVERLLARHDAPLLLKTKSGRGCTPLMLASMGYCSEELTERMLEFGGNVVQAALHSSNGRTAAEYAALHHATPRLCAKLQAAELEDRASLCMVCGARLSSRPKLAKLVTSCGRHEENHEILTRFVANSSQVVEMLLGPSFHTLNDDKALRKKLSQSLSILEALESIVPSLQGWHIIDLCCGKTLTSALAVMRHQGCVATAVDRVAPSAVAHYEEAGLNTVRYRRLNVMAEDAVETLHSWSLDDGGAWEGRPVAILGMHLCGQLSEQAVKLFHCCSQAKVCVLSPCCLPPLEKAPIALQPLYRRRMGVDFEILDGQQYRGWCEHLRLLLSAVPGTKVKSVQAPEMFSTKRTVISAVRDE